jgi:AcrR family transcriptional regulator
MQDHVLEWVEAGYGFFALEGPEGINIEKIARKIGLNKSGFYHHFGDREVFIQKILEYHLQRNEQFYAELLHASQFDPDVLNLIIKYKEIAEVQSQLRKNMSNPAFEKAFQSVKTRNQKAYVKHWAEYLKISENEVASNLWDIMRDIYFIHFMYKKLTFKTLQDLVRGFSQTINQVKRLNTGNQELGK